MEGGNCNSGELTGGDLRTGASPCAIEGLWLRELVVFAATIWKMARVMDFPVDSLGIMNGLAMIAFTRLLVIDTAAHA
jgi:hypothetical protein